ncbi:MAG: hypothetical protein AAF125_05795 [Chloroflexota bacterium]
MRIRFLSVALMVTSLVSFGLAVASCAPDTTAPTLEVRATQAIVETALPEPLVVADSAIISTLPPFTDTACLDCHTNQERLEALALPEEDNDHEALSSGPG